MSGKSQLSVWEILTNENVWENRIGQENEIFGRKWPQNRVDVFCSPDDRIGHVTYII